MALSDFVICCQIAVPKTLDLFNSAEIRLIKLEIGKGIQLKHLLGGC